MEILNGRKILLIAPTYHNYITAITTAFNRLGAQTESYTTEPAKLLYSNFYFTRLQKFKIFQKLYNRQVLITNRNILNSIKGKQYNHIIIIKGRLLTDEFIIELKKLLPTANIIMYQWDSIDNYNYLERIKYFHEVFSFDYADCKKVERITYLPLFYSEEFGNIASIEEINYAYDLFSLGVNHSNRIARLLEIIDLCEEKGLKYSCNLMTSISEKFRLVRENNNKINCFFKPLKFGEFAEMYIKSKAIIDISSPSQTGLPIRIIEAIGANKKIVTTNSNIIKEEFYDPKRVFIWGQDDPEELNHFLNQKHEKRAFEKYSVKSFALRLISPVNQPSTTSGNDLA